MFSLGIAQLLRYSYSADLLDLQNAIDLTSRWKVRFRKTFFFQNEVQRVLYKLVLGTYPLPPFWRIYSPLNFMFIQKLKNQMYPYKQQLHYQRLI